MPQDEARHRHDEGEVFGLGRKQFRRDQHGRIGKTAGGFPGHAERVSQLFHPGLDFQIELAQTPGQDPDFNQRFFGLLRRPLELDREADEEDDGDAPENASPLPLGSKNYMTPAGFARLKDELDHLLGRERPELVATIAWAAGNGDRSENGDYIYGKKRLREVDRRIRFLVKRLDAAEVVDPQSRRDEGEDDRVYFGATVTVRNAKDEDRTVSIVGVDEIDTARGYISWVSPMARALLRAREGDTVTLNTPGGVEDLEILLVRYERLATGDLPAGAATS